MNIQLFIAQPQHPKNQSKLAQLKQAHEVSLVNDLAGKPTLIVDQGRLGLIDGNWPKVLPIFVDFTAGAANYRRLHGGGKSQAVAKAVGLNKRKDLTILDATAGLGRDAFVFACLGAKVLLHERHPLVYLLLADGLQRLAESEDHEHQLLAKRMSLQPGGLLESPAPVDVDVVYLDPMFPQRTKSAKIKKDMAMFHALVGSDADADQLLPIAIAIARHRVAVKRPKGAAYLAARQPTLTLEGKANRFDIYTRAAL